MSYLQTNYNAFHGVKARHVFSELFSVLFLNKIVLFSNRSYDDAFNVRNIGYNVNIGNDLVIMLMVTD